MFDRIPHEMRFYRQWIVWRYEESEGKKPTKNLYSPLWGTQATVTAPATWGSYDDAVKAYEAGGWAGIGFVFTADDPYSGIDLDDTDGDAEAYQRQVRIFQDFPSYAEYSPSGTGLHIIVKGKVERGRRRSKIEIYSKERFFTMTGNVYRDGPIVDCNEQLQILWQAMGGAATVHENAMDQPEREDDNSVLTRMFEAVNGEKARELYNGNWEQFYASQSEADFALIDIVAFYTQNRFQITRIFQSSGLGQRDKAKRIDYVYRMINRAFDRMLPPLDIDAMNIAQQEAIAAVEAAQMKTATPEGPSAAVTMSDRPGGQSTHGLDGMPYDPARVNPPGLVGEIADFIFAAAPRPVYEIALAGAIGLVAGIGARAFNVMGMGLNQYVMLLAPTGTGKEAINSGISKLINAVTPTTPHAPKFIGPGEIRSDAALLKWLAREPCFLSIAGEFGLRLKQMSAPNANSHEIGLRKVMLDLYSKSGFGEQLNPMAYSDREKNTDTIKSPCFTMIGESTPERFYEALDESMIYEGLLPRFTFIEYNGNRPPLNKHRMVEPGFALVDQLGSFIAHASQLMAGGKGVHVVLHPEAEALLDAFDKYCDAMCNSNGSREVTRQFWTRAHVKAVRLAATIAVGCNWDAPCIDKQTAQWATDLVVKDVTHLIGKFERGEVGEVNPYGADETKQLDDLISVVASIVRGTAEEASKYGLIAEVHKAGIVTWSALSRACLQRASFRKDRMGSTNALKRAVQHLLDADELREVPKAQMTKDYGIGARSFIISRPARFFR